AEAGLSIDDVELQPLQHADGRSALEGDSVEAWSGLDPIMAAAEVESGARLVFRAVDFNTYGFLNATEEFIDQHADVAQVVVDAYEQARTWALANPEGTAQLLADAAGIDLAVATTVIAERSNLDVPGIPGEDQLAVLEAISPVLADSGDVAGGADAVADALGTTVPPSPGPAPTDPSAAAPAGGPRTLWDRPGVRAAAGALLPLLILAAWQLVTSTGLVPAYRLPGPLTVLQAGADLASRGELGLHLAISVQRVP